MTNFKSVMTQTVTDLKNKKDWHILNNKFCEIYNPTKHLSVDEVVVLYVGRVVSWQYSPKKHKRFGTKI
jgi:hypothetical protein